MELTGRWRVVRGALADLAEGTEVDVIAGYGGVHWFARPGTGIIIRQVVEAGAATTPGGNLVLRDDGGESELARVPEAVRPSPIEQLVEGDPPTIVRTYRSPTHDEAAAAMTTESSALAERGYRLVSQSWAAPEKRLLTGIAGLALVLTAIPFFGLVLGNLFVAVLILAIGIALLADHGGSPPGSLTATFERRPELAATTRAGDTGARTTRERLAELDGLHRDAVVSDEEYAARRAAILESI